MTCESAKKARSPKADLTMVVMVKEAQPCADIVTAFVALALAVEWNPS